MSTESYALAGVGPPASSVSMPPETLPPELWHSIITFLDGYCFAWHVLRRVSPYLRLVTEDAFARNMLHACSLRFAGETAQNLLPHDLRDGILTHNAMLYHAEDFIQLPTFRFCVHAFMPADTKAKVILKLCAPTYEHKHIPAQQIQEIRLEPIESLANIFFQPGAEADSKRARLMNGAHFIRFDGQLKSIRIPSLVIDIVAREITLDWRQLCQDFLCDEYKCRLHSLESWSVRLLSE